MPSALLQSALIILLPILWPICQRKYAQLRSILQTKPRTLTRHEVYRLCAVCGASLVYLALLGRALYAERDIFQLTHSRLSIPLDVLKARVNRISPQTSIPWSALNTPDNVLTYVRLGSRPFTQCDWCSISNLNSFAYYAIGTTGLNYVLHFMLLTIALDGQGLLSIWTVAISAIECTCRLGLLDFINIEKRQTMGVLHLHYLVETIRNGLFALNLVLAGFSLYMGAKFGQPEQGLSYSKQKLVDSIEVLRVANAMNWSVKESAPLQSYIDSFWTRNEELRTRIEADPAVLEARQLASHDRTDEKQFQSFVESTTTKHLV